MCVCFKYNYGKGVSIQTVIYNLYISAQSNFCESYIALLSLIYDNFIYIILGRLRPNVLKNLPIILFRTAHFSIPIILIFSSHYSCIVSKHSINHA